MHHITIKNRQKGSGTFFCFLGCLLDRRSIPGFAVELCVRTAPCGIHHTGKPIKRYLTPLFVLMLACGGCGDDYARSNVTDDSPEARQVRSMIETLRSGADRVDEVISAQQAGQLNDRQKSAVRAMLEEIISADAVELKRIDQFGDHIYRATLTLREGEIDRQLFVLLAKQDSHLRWACPN